MTTLTVGTSGQEYTTLSAAVAAAHSGDTIDLKSGTYTNDFPGLITDLTIEGVGGSAKLVATAQPSNGKAILDVAGNTTLKNLDISGVTVPDANGAAIRYESGNLVIQNTAIHNNQDGILGAASNDGTITIDGSEIYANGTNAGNTHNIYIGDIKTFTLTNSYIHDANTGHEVKSRAENNVIQNNRIEDNSSTASYEIDLPNGGNATISGNTIQKSASSGNHVIIAYGEEGSAHAGTTVSITGNTLASDQSGAYAIWDTTGAAVRASGNTTYNISQIDKAGHVSASGFNATTTRPTLDTSSPINRSGSTTTPTPTPAPTPTPTPAPTPPADTTAPSLTASESVSGNTTQTSNVISGTVSDSGSGVAQVEIYDATGGRTVDLGRATLNGSAWSYTASNLALGTHAFSAIATDKAGNATASISAGASETITAPTPTPAPTPAPAPTPTPTPTPAPTPTPVQTGLQAVSQVNGGLQFKGNAPAGSGVVLNDTVNGQSKFIGSDLVRSDGSWTITVDTVDSHAANTLTTLVAAGSSFGVTGPALILSSAASETLSGTAGKADLFAFLPSFGKDIVRGFETTATSGAAHDVIDLVGSAYQSFDQLQSHISGAGSAVIRVDAANSITLSGVNANSLQASDFRFS